ncbi:hypothetical protein [Asticcacaulis sp. AND118]|uniref:hypothetical protein n=1 Tax=Asticcacaulis sp. AND118 TaxID=2840468 RepID=UPI001D00182E|nr:hypothetical protein [Asticcacaulis sp. AND118]UDF02838.1 hypothetical protein LH365_10400 [Asticcacaulis sp. AND118]
MADGVDRIDLSRACLCDREHRDKVPAIGYVCGFVVSLRVTLASIPVFPEFYAPAATLMSLNPWQDESLWAGDGPPENLYFAPLKI